MLFVIAVKEEGFVTVEAVSNGESAVNGCLIEEGDFCFAGCHMLQPKNR